jgi:DNA-directed RNA polymerase sigma subunit (sigma70/sigma32)
MTAPARRVYGEPGDSVGLYLRSVGRHPLLDKAQEAALAQAVEAGNAARAELGRLAEQGEPVGSLQEQLEGIASAGAMAKALFVESNLRLVVVLAQRRHASGVPLGDLIQEGNLGLIRAVEKFDWRTGWKFSTYAKWWIRQAINDAVASHSRTIRLPARIWAQLRELRMASAELAAGYGRAATTAELAEHLGVSTTRVEELLMWSMVPGSLSERLGGEGGMEVGDRVADPDAHLQFDATARPSWRSEVDRLFEVLGEREREVLRLRFGLVGGEALSLGETGRRLGLTGERVRQIQVAALAKLREAASDETRDDVLLSA